MCGGHRSRKTGNRSAHLKGNNGASRTFNKNLGGYSGREINYITAELKQTPGVHCFSCGFNNPIKENNTINFCKNCGEKIQICEISKRHFSEGEEFSQCSNCRSLFHSHHFQSLLRSDDQCPVCRVKLDNVYVGRVGINLIMTPTA